MWSLDLVVGTYAVGILIVFFSSRWFVTGEPNDLPVGALALFWPFMLIIGILAGLWLGFLGLLNWTDVPIAIALSKIVSEDDRGAIRQGPHLPGEREPFVFVEFRDPAQGHRKVRRRVSPSFANEHMARRTPTDAIAAFWGIDGDEYKPDVET